MNNSSNLLVLGVTGQVGRLVAKDLKRSGANFSVGTRKKANLKELAGISLVTGYTRSVLSRFGFSDVFIGKIVFAEAAAVIRLNHVVHLGAIR